MRKNIILIICFVILAGNLNAIVYNDIKNITEKLNSTLINTIDLIDGFGLGLNA